MGGNLSVAFVGEMLFIGVKQIRRSNAANTTGLQDRIECAKLVNGIRKAFADARARHRQAHRDHGQSGTCRRSIAQHSGVLLGHFANGGNVGKVPNISIPVCRDEDVGLKRIDHLDDAEPDSIRKALKAHAPTGQVRDLSADPPADDFRERIAKPGHQRKPRRVIPFRSGQRQGVTANYEMERHRAAVAQTCRCA